MTEYILLMHGDAEQAVRDADWGNYLSGLRGRGVFDGGSGIGTGACFRKSGAAADVSKDITGYIRVRAESLDAARALLAGNPVYEAGGTIEVRELPRT